MTIDAAHTPPPSYRRLSDDAATPITPSRLRAIKMRVARLRLFLMLPYAAASPDAAVLALSTRERCCRVPPLYATPCHFLFSPTLRAICRDQFAADTPTAVGLSQRRRCREVSAAFSCHADYRFSRAAWPMPLCCRLRQASVRCGARLPQR